MLFACLLLAPGLITTSSPRLLAAAATNAAALPRTDANGNPLRRAPTGHVSNYDEAKVTPCQLPDPLVLQDAASEWKGKWITASSTARVSP